MNVFKKTLPRRTVLRGLGASIALPLLDSMVPALATASTPTVQSPKRLGVVYVPNGMAMKSWTPTTEGSGFELTRILQPMAAHQDRMLIISGLNGTNSNAGVHASASTRFLTGAIPARSESDLQAAVSVDQLIARELGKQTQLGSLELALDQSDVFGSCDIGFSCQYTSTISWRDAYTPLPMETNPRAVFERLFGDTGTTDPAVRLNRIRKDQSLLDSVSDRVSQLNRKVGAGDRAKLDQYLDAIRDGDACSGPNGGTTASRRSGPCGGGRCCHWLAGLCQDSCRCQSCSALYRAGAGRARPAGAGHARTGRPAGS